MLSPVLDRVFPLFPASWRLHRVELERMLRFVLVGGLSFVFNYGLYVLLSRVIWTIGNRTAINFVSTSITCVLNYLAHRAWTFQSQGAHGTQAARYILVALSAIGLQSFLFWIGYHVLGAHDLVVIFVVAILIPFYTYLAHKLFTFRATGMIT